MQAASYRRNRVLLTGDAAYIHSPLGGQGLNVGLVQRDQGQGEDSGNTYDLTLLDIYESERHPIATWVLDWTRAQVTALKPDAFGRAMRTLTEDLIKTDDGANLFINRVWGLSQRYTLGEEPRHIHLLVGSSAPDFEFGDGSRLGSKLEKGRGLLLDFGNSSEMESIVDGKYSGKVDYLATEAKKTCGLSALLIRPDGIVAWVEENAQHNIDALKAALGDWFIL
ncbi:hypothetical protein AARAC_012002 [Aspergillus arachidicola]|uniref:FAD-binding domain-containing protein n=1 Tax=Aspergillus arachidicola TaxID=656916 RepID=A0A2G7FGG4_9EURO|nr:hypothetical protein AARAC_012002 [Aspergillus arachidicola]